MPLKSSIRLFTPAKIALTHSEAASFFWTRILMGKLPEPLVEKLQKWPSFAVINEAKERAEARKKQTSINPNWSYHFQQELEKLLHGKPMYTTLKLDYHPTGLLEDAARKSGVDYQLFPKEKLTMTFSDKGLIINNSQVVNPQDLMRLVTYEEDQVIPHSYVPLGFVRRNG